MLGFCLFSSEANSWKPVYMWVHLWVWAPEMCGYIENLGTDI